MQLVISSDTCLTCLTILGIGISIKEQQQLGHSGVVGSGSMVQRHKALQHCASFYTLQRTIVHSPQQQDVLCTYCWTSFCCVLSTWSGQYHAISHACTSQFAATFDCMRAYPSGISGMNTSAFTVCSTFLFMNGKATKAGTEAIATCALSAFTSAPKPSSMYAVRPSLVAQ